MIDKTARLSFPIMYSATNYRISIEMFHQFLFFSQPPSHVQSIIDLIVDWDLSLTILFWHFPRKSVFDLTVYFYYCSYYYVCEYICFLLWNFHVVRTGNFTFGQYKNKTLQRESLLEFLSFCQFFVLTSFLSLN